MSKLEAAVAARDGEITGLRKQLADVDKAEKNYTTGGGKPGSPGYMRGRGSEGDKVEKVSKEVDASTKEACRREGYRKGAVITIYGHITLHATPLV